MEAVTAGDEIALELAVLTGLDVAQARPVARDVERRDLFGLVDGRQAGRA